MLAIGMVMSSNAACGSLPEPEWFREKGAQEVV